MQNQLIPELDETDIRLTGRQNAANENPGEKPLRVGLPCAKGIVFVSAHTIIRCEAVGNYTRFYFTSSDKMVVCKTLRYFEEQLAAAGFMRIHRGDLVNKEYIEKYDRNGVLWLTDGSQLVVSKRKKRGFFMAITC